MTHRTITTMADAEATLREYYLASGLPAIGTNFRFENTIELAERVGNPQKRLKVVHVAGTSGKTSTAYYAAALLRQSGKKVGLTVSPHISSITERVQINGAALDGATFARYFAEYLPLATANGTIQPSFFELMMLFALWVFEREELDYAVVETGMGGLYDASNICRRPDKLCVITDIGLDHTHILGTTLGEIAEQKAGIIAVNNTVCMYEQGSAVMEAVKKAVTTQHAMLVLATPTVKRTYFDRNFQLAYVAYKQLLARDDSLLLNEQQIAQARTTAIPGRLEAFRFDDTTVVLDGAHNEQKMRTMFETLDTLYGSGKWAVVLALKQDKDASGIVPLIGAHASTILASEYSESQDMPHAPIPAHELAAYFEGEGSPVWVEPSLVAALQVALKAHEPRILVVGSFYAVSEARKWLLEHGAAVQ
ncbi:hypothetical protein EOL96_07060 [Candidatus Saccharibacteria bacterium]|nr:hypothetical protein [Candidatus Saccharibacteria bacterium]